MLYRVTARPVEEALPEFYRLLTDGTIANQEPDGKEIVASMHRAVVKNGLVEWTETCYCDPPLRHERATIFDRFFTDMMLAPSRSVSAPEGKSFWSYLASKSLQPAMHEESLLSGSMIRALGRNTV